VDVEKWGFLDLAYLGVVLAFGRGGFDDEVRETLVIG
jgi:hypothetical protein